MQHILGTLRRAVNDYDMIEDGDRIAVGVSGGKDSAVLLYALSLFSKFSPKPFKTVAITVDMAFSDKIAKKVETRNTLADYEEFCRKIEVPFYVEKTEISHIIFEERKEKNPCSLCSKMRRGALNSKARELGCNKVALGHHSDDVLETFFLSLLFEGRVSTFKPVTYLDKTDLTVIRPLIYTAEHEVVTAAAKHNLPIIVSPCPADKNTKREEMKDLIKKLNNEFKGSKDLMLSALFHPERTNLWEKPDIEV